MLKVISLATSLVAETSVSAEEVVRPVTSATSRFDHPIREPGVAFTGAVG